MTISTTTSESIAVMERLPEAIYAAKTLRQLDKEAALALGITGFELMCRAAEAAFVQLRSEWPDVRRLTVVAGKGNNGGDGLVLAGLALKLHWQVQLLLPLAPTQYLETLQGEAAEAWQWLQQQQLSGLLMIHDGDELPDCHGELVVDALLGTGLAGEVQGRYAALIDWINATGRPVLALDIPSGLECDSGNVLGRAVRASHTVTFIGMKAGLLTGQGAAYAGQVHCHGLGTPEHVYAHHVPLLQRVTPSQCKQVLPPRPRDGHKGMHGHVLIVGGNLGMAGAALLAGRSALRSGAGLVSVVTRHEHVPAFIASQPELMVQGVRNGLEAQAWIARADVLVIGPGLGRDAWAEQLLQQALASAKPLVIDADALHLLKHKHWRPSGLWVMTPHPGEAAMLLDRNTAVIQRERLQALADLQQTYGATVVLKGKGTLIASPGAISQLVSEGNPGMSVAGMGDILAGVIGSLLAQGLTPSAAAAVGASIHGRAGDLAALERGERGLLATDLLPYIQQLVNPL
ncbi:hypothetical protein WH50_06580 [Pokkaliibacter plantistimulans]|uniref:Bifunctional NAD(P)H-hydrate repair enzyme n=1 Tax=Pokkaliibacter plantistimulans TaxID=1635171 RepID=A0ABX5M368_9GAMM|nr:NAD(P)H-hydrate dehydratase [Pokkaliibacter plantistimulans]PXF31993.1 hypothetical protein WH50_06580 [Pokkaliibacter plantistimulans]